VFSPARFPYKDTVWRSPLIVVVDTETWSAAEEFVSVLQDNRAAVIVGAPTGGAGCGHTDGGTPATLKHSGGVLELPDCARFRVPFQPVDATPSTLIDKDLNSVAFLRRGFATIQGRVSTSEKDQETVLLAINADLTSTCRCVS
jgi:hypothetical protein